MKNENLNPKGRKANDCVVRAIMKATGMKWREVYDGLCQIGQEEFDMPNSKRVYEAYLSHIGWRKQPMPRFPDNSRYTVKEFCTMFNRGAFIVSIANHMTAVIDGEVFDTWDCTRKSVGNFWKK